METKIIITKDYLIIKQAYINARMIYEEAYDNWEERYDYEIFDQIVGDARDVRDALLEKAEEELNDRHKELESDFLKLEVKLEADCAAIYDKADKESSLAWMKFIKKQLV